MVVRLLIKERIEISKLQLLLDFQITSYSFVWHRKWMYVTADICLDISFNNREIHQKSYFENSYP